MPQYFGASVPRGLAVPLLADDAFYGHLKGKIQRPGGGGALFLSAPSVLPPPPAVGEIYVLFESNSCE